MDINDRKHSLQEYGFIKSQAEIFILEDNLSKAIFAQEQTVKFLREVEGIAEYPVTEMRTALYNLARYYQIAGLSQKAIRTMEEVVQLDKLTDSPSVKFSLATLSYLRTSILNEQDEVSDVRVTDYRKLIEEAYDIRDKVFSVTRGLANADPLIIYLESYSQTENVAGSPEDDFQYFVKAIVLLLQNRTKMLPVPPPYTSQYIAIQAALMD